VRKTKNTPEPEEEVIEWHGSAAAHLLGVRVKLSYAGADYWGDNDSQGGGGQGVVYGTDAEWVQVEWNNGYFNHYKSGDLVRVPTEPKQPTTKQATFWDV
jgi:hypothetical protein